MIILKAMNAYLAATQMMEREQDYETAHALVLLKARLQPHMDFYVEQETALVRKYGRKNKKGEVVYDARGHFRFASPEAGEAYRKKKLELDRTEVQEDWEQLRVPKPERIVPAQLEALQDFLVFEEVEA